MMSKMIVKVMKNQLNSVLPGPCDCVFIHIKNRPTETIDIVANVARWQECLRIWLKQGKEKDSWQGFKRSHSPNNYARTQ